MAGIEDKMRLVEPAGVSTEMVPKKNCLSRRGRLLSMRLAHRKACQPQISMCVPRGTVIMKSTVHGLVSIDTAPAIVNEITLVGSRCGRFEAALPLLSSGKIQVGPMISEEFPLDRAPQAFATAAKKGVLKVLLRP